ALDRLDELVITENMHERKHTMFEKSDAFVALPGGIGTVEEIIEIMTWGQLGHHRKPIVFGNVGGFWDPML
ncbi:MAG: LOG family protein, partial [Mesorhizobium sp.]